MLRTITFSTLFPNSIVRHHGIFVETRLRHLLRSGQVETKILAPVPWFPSESNIFGRYSIFAGVPASENLDGLEVRHPKYLAIPYVGMNITPVTLAMAALPSLRQILKRNFSPHLIDAHYFYPDGVAAVLLSRWLNLPVVVTARGTDINLIPEYALPRRWIKWAMRYCDGIIAVSDALRARLLELGANPGSTITLRNGVDLSLFRPENDRELLRGKLSVKGITLLSVGHLIERKGHHLVIEAMTLLPELNLIIVGEGPDRSELERQAAQLGVADRVRFVGTMNQSRLREYYCAADILVLASSREGMANVLLESIACGTPVVATPLWGAPEVITGASCGALTQDRSVPAIVESVTRLLSSMPSRSDVRIFAQRFNWDSTTEGQLSLFHEIRDRHV